MMKTIKTIVLGLLGIVLFYACNQDDAPIQPEPQVIDKPKPKPEPVNQAPKGFLLLTPEFDSAIVNRTPTFSWEQATDPDGDMVTYDLYIDIQENPNTVVAENLVTTSFELEERLEFETQYYWKVVAKDGKGASADASQPLRVEIPTKLLRRYAINNESDPVEFEYSNGKLLRIGQYFPDYQGSPSKIDKLRHINSVITHYYEYTDSGEQLLVNNGDSTDGERWIFQYDDSNRLSSITKEIRSDQGQGGIETISLQSIFLYSDANSTKANIIKTTLGDEISRYALKWQGDNIVEIILEELNVGAGFQFEGKVKIVYDDNINPYYAIISDQFGFNPIHVFNESLSGLESIDFFIFRWQSFNNITAYEVFDDENATEPSEGYRVDYSYSEDYYPFAAQFYNISTNSTDQINWSYLDE